MATYLISSEITITRQEGDTADIVFTGPGASVIDFTNYTEVTFAVKTNGQTAVFEKSISEGTISKNEQVITIPLLSADTKGKAGTHRWEMQISNATPEIITIGKGRFVITSEIIK